jgi:lipid-A-disaccharide synthase
MENEYKYEIFAIAKMAIAKSGTNNLEMLSFGLPIITIYKANYLTYWIIRSISKIKFANLVNISTNKEIIPELIQENCTGKKIAQLTLKMINDDDFLQNQIQQTKKVVANFSLKGGFAQNIVKELM